MKTARVLFVLGLVFSTQIAIAGNDVQKDPEKVSETSVAFNGVGAAWLAGEQLRGDSVFDKLDKQLEKRYPAEMSQVKLAEKELAEAKTKKAVRLAERHYKKAEDALYKRKFAQALTYLANDKYLVSLSRAHIPGVMVVMGTGLQIGAWSQAVTERNEIRKITAERLANDQQSSTGQTASTR